MPPGEDTKVSSEAKTSSRPQHFSDIVRHKLQSPRTDNAQKSEEKQKLKSSFRQPHFDEGPIFRTKSVKNSDKPGNERKTNEKDELVKHMSNLPGYLQKLGKPENFQDKALNFGVLDWNLLEKWKYSDGGLPRINADVSFSGSSLARYKRQPQLHSSCPNLTKEKSVTTLRNTFDEPKNPHRINTPFIKNTCVIKPDKGISRHVDRIAISEKETSLSGFRKNEVSNSGKVVKSARKKLITSREELLQSSVCLNKKDFPKELNSLALISPKHSPELNCQDIVHTSESILSVDGKSKEADNETLLRSNSPIHARTLELSNTGSCSSEKQTASPQYKCIDTRTPRSNPYRGNEVETPRSSDYEMHESAAVKGTAASPSRRFSFSFGKISRSLSFKENSAVPRPSTPPVAVRSEPSHRFSSDEVRSSGELYPYILHSCPLPSGSKTKDESTTRLRTPIIVNKTPQKQSSEDVIGPTEFDVVQSRFSSPNRRFGFSLSKMKRSLSFKEDLNTPQLGPMRSEVSDSLVTPNEKKDSLCSKSRSSPLRRLLDPILKTRVTHPCPSTETSSSSKENPNLLSENKSFAEPKPRESMIQALLQVTAKNGLPLFKLVVNNSSDILVAMKNLSPSGKQDFDSIYTFYSVHEIKKKSGSWINQVHKEKSYGFGYTVVGQMKGFNRFCAESSVDNFKNRFTQKEFVLFSVDRKQGDGEAPELVPRRELASIIVKIPHERNISKGLIGKEFSEYLEEEKFLFGRGESEKFHNTTVILSGADHGLPVDGVPSSLIQRWRSGGSCDCGGWDVGCKLQILTNEDHSCGLPEPSVSSSKRESFDLFIQGGAHENKPIFRLAPFKKGIYSIEFSASISLLQALSTCIAAISSRQSFKLSELNFLSDENKESTFSGCSGIQIPSKAQESLRKYRPSPPPSPVGRV